MRKIIVSLGSQLGHSFKFFRLIFKQPRMNLERGMLIVSIDIDVGNKRVAMRNGGRNDINVHDYLTEYEVGAIEEVALPLFVNLFDHFLMPVTLAVRGQLWDVGEPALDPILRTSVQHDIGAHGYSHRSFQELSVDEADEELNLVSVLMNKYGIVPKSFVFPKNRIGHLNLLEKHGYKCYREIGSLALDDMYIKKNNQLYDVHPSLYIDQYTKPFLLKRMLGICVREKLPFHIWFHLWNFGYEKKSIVRSINKVIVPFLEHAQRKVDEGELAFETMLSSIDNLKNSNKNIAY